MSDKSGPVQHEHFVPLPSGRRMVLPGRGGSSPDPNRRPNGGRLRLWVRFSALIGRTPGIIVALVLLALVLLMGTIGFHVVEGWSFFDALYMSLITITTIGYQELYTLSHAGRVLNTVLILLGVGTFTYTVTQLMHMLVQQELRVFFKVRAMEKSLGRLKDHFIVCGAGRLGSRIVQHLQDAGSPFVVIEQDPVVVERLVELGVSVVTGDATAEASMTRAGVARAQGLVTAIGSDPQNVYISLTARDLNPTLCIVARANSVEAELRLRRAGANRVISPERIGSRQMADALLRPAVIDFFDDVMESSEVRVNMDDVLVGRGSELDGVTLRDASLPSRAGVNVIRIGQADGVTLYRPDSDTVLRAGDHLVVVGDSGALDRLRSLCRPVPIKV